MKTYLSICLVLCAPFLLASAAGNCNRLLLSNTTVESLRAKIKTAQVNDKIPAIAYAVSSEDGEVLHDAFGTSGNFGHPLNAQKTLFRTASISKLVTSIAVSQLVEEGIFSFETKFMDLKKTPIVRFLEQHETPERLAKWSQVTIGQMLSHKAGFSKDLPGTLLFANSESLAQNSYPTLSELYRGILTVEFLYEPGQIDVGIKYSDLSMNLLARVVETYNRQSLQFATYVTRKIFQPLGMNDSFYDIPKSRRLDLVKSYGALLPDQTRTLSPKALEVGSYDGSIGVASTATDLSKLGRELLRMVNGRSSILSKREVVSYLLMPKSPVTNSLAWASGPLWQYLPTETGGSIWLGGAGTGSSERGVLYVSPEKNMVVVALFDTKDANRDAYAKLISDTLGGFPQHMTTIGTQRVQDAKTFLSSFIAPTISTLPPYPNPQELAPFVGTYVADLSGVSKVTQSSDGYLVVSGQKLIVEDLQKGQFRFPSIAGPAGIDISREPVVFKFDAFGKPIEFTNAQVRIFRRQATSPP